MAQTIEALAKQYGDQQVADSQEAFLLYFLQKGKSLDALTKEDFQNLTEEDFNQLVDLAKGIRASREYTMARARSIVSDITMRLNSR